MLHVIISLIAPAHATEFVVPSSTHASIQSAVNAASNGDTIIVTTDLDGPVLITGKNLTVRGLGMNSLALTSPTSPVIQVDGGSVVSLMHFTIDGEDVRRGLHVAGAGTSVSVEGVKLQDGRRMNAHGGNARVLNGTLDLRNSIVCGGYCDNYRGAGIYVDSAGVLTATGVALFDNATDDTSNNNDNEGGAIYAIGDTDVAESTFYANSAHNGAAIHAFGVTVALNDCVVAQNDDQHNHEALTIEDGGDYTGGNNLYFSNSNGNIEGGNLPGDQTGDPNINNPTVSCSNATMADFSATLGGLADTKNVGAVGVDTDGDGYGTGPDCAEVDGTIHPGASESPGDAVDQNCDGVEQCFVDVDGDGARDPGNTIWTTDLLCSGPGLAPFSAPIDCNDAQASIYEGAPEIVADGIDQDCDGGDLCYADLDNDGFRTNATVASADLDCNDSGEAVFGDPANDCNDNDASIRPGALDLVGDGIDGNCDGMEVCYTDGDGDGYADLTNTQVSSDADCDDGTESVATAADCDDTRNGVNPGASETPDNGRDQDCDGKELCYVDADNDGGRTDATVSSDDLVCTGAGEGQFADPIDCDDNDPAVGPLAAEIPGDDFDQNCDGLEDCFADADTDAYRSFDVLIETSDIACAGAGLALESTAIDCDDSNSARNPGIPEIAADGIDQDCDGTEICYDDSDGDGYQDISGGTVVSADTDCDDAGETDSNDASDCLDDDITSNPGALEQCGDGADNNCDGTVDENTVNQDWFIDADGDGYGDGSSPSINDCVAPVGYVANGEDCDDTFNGTSPGLPEIPCDGVDNDCSYETSDEVGCDTGDPTDTGISTDTGIPADTDSDTDADTDSDTDADADGDTDADADTDSDTDADTDTDTTGGGETVVNVNPAALNGCSCSAGATSMVWVGWLGPLSAVLLRRR